MSFQYLRNVSFNVTDMVFVGCLTLSGALELRRSQTRINGSVSRGMDVISFVGYIAVSPRMDKMRAHS